MMGARQRPDLDSCRASRPQGAGELAGGAGGGQDVVDDGNRGRGAASNLEGIADIAPPRDGVQAALHCGRTSAACQARGYRYA